MIKRNSSKITASIVNAAQDEHFNISEGIRTDVPITDSKSVVKSINFLSEQDGSYTLRPPLILKEHLNTNMWYLYDNTHLLTITANGTISITNPENADDVAHITLKYFDKTINLNKLDFSIVEDYVLTFINKIVSVTNLQDYTLLSIKLDHDKFEDYVDEYNLAHTTTNSNQLIYSWTNYTENYPDGLYRLVKIYQDTSSDTVSWIIEIVYPELNSITSSTNTESNLDVNLLLDNPYAIRDLYGYGYISTTKILAYVAKGLTKVQVDDNTVGQLTESSILSTPGSSPVGYKILVSTNPKDSSINSLILKAFLTTTLSNAAYYCCWEESTNGGIDWTECQAFIDKFNLTDTDKKLVSDLTSSEFEKMAYKDSLEEAASYLVEKKMLRLNLTQNDFSETDLISTRPDVLYISNPDFSKMYRFQVYVDTEKTSPVESGVTSTTIYLASTTGVFQVPYSEDIVYAESLNYERELLFTGKFIDYENQILAFNKYNIFASDLDSTIFKVLNTLTFSTELVKLIRWRNYLLAFTEKDISLLKYFYDTGSYSQKIISNAIGVLKKDADTIVCILNSVYFKSGYRIYKLVPNLYASIDDILNIHSVSDSINALIEDTLSPEIETKNFMYANTYKYYLFIPIINKGITYSFVYDLTNKVWNFFKYPLIIKDIVYLGLNREFLKTDSGLYYFKDKIDTLLKEELVHNPTEIGYDSLYGIVAEVNGETLDVAILSDNYSKMESLIPKIPYTDFLNDTLKNIYLFLENNIIEIDDINYLIKSYTTNNQIQMTPIEYLIDFGQKSSNYTLDKTFLETKLTLATLSEKDTFPFELYISTDGIQSPLHWDVNTDSALWKNSFSNKGTLGTLFVSNTSEYRGIMRKLIVKYSGKGKTIHHIITGLSKYNFKFYSMDVRSRILPKKQ